MAFVNRPISLAGGCGAMYGTLMDGVCGVGQGWLGLIVHNEQLPDWGGVR